MSLLRVVVLLSIPLLAFCMVVWPEITAEDGHFDKPRPQGWEEKHFGQWCRNFTAHKHQQCPEASMLHEYQCCGETNAECCFAIQGWLVVVGGISSITTTCIIVFYALLKLDMIFVEKTYPPKTIYIGGRIESTRLIDETMIPSSNQTPN